MKELKGWFGLRQPEVEENVWNPVKELKVDYYRRTVAEMDRRWNPVKELKGTRPEHRRADYVVFVDVESGEGIERFSLCSPHSV